MFKPAKKPLVGFRNAIYAVCKVKLTVFNYVQTQKRERFYAL